MGVETDINDLLFNAVNFRQITVEIWLLSDGIYNFIDLL